MSLGQAPGSAARKVFSGCWSVSSWSDSSQPVTESPLAAGKSPASHVSVQGQLLAWVGISLVTGSFKPVSLASLSHQLGKA